MKQIMIYVPLNGLSLSETNGEVVDLGNLPDSLLKPLIITDSGLVEGAQVGRRSALLADPDAGKFYRIKACKPTTEIYRDGFADPEGGQLLSRAQQEIEISADLADILKSEGLTPAYRPSGLFIYEIEFQSPKRGKAERLAASIFEVEGETRLADWIGYITGERLMTHLLHTSPEHYPGYAWFNSRIAPTLPMYEEVPDELKTILSNFAIWAGGLKRIMDNNNYTWDSLDDATNAHIGNYPMIGDGETIALGLVDLADCIKWNKADHTEMRKTQEFEFQRLSHGPSYWRRGFERGYNGASLPTITESDLNAVAKSMNEFYDGMKV